MKKIAWIIYGVLIILFTLLVLAVAITSGNALIVTIISSAFTIIYLSGLYGFVYKKAIWKASGWRVLFWLNIVSLGLRSLILFTSPATELIIDIAFQILFSIPILYALYKYSSPDNSVWSETHYGKLGATLSKLLTGTGELQTSVVTEKSSGDITTKVSIKNKENEFIVNIEKEINGEIQSFSNAFYDLTDAAKFIESNTPVRATDFA